MNQNQNQTVKVSKKAVSKKAAAKAYRDAANVITERGWITGAIERKEYGGVCALGGLHHALIKSGLADRLFQEFGSGMKDYAPGSATSLAASVGSEILRYRKYTYTDAASKEYNTVAGLNTIEIENKVIRKRFPDRVSSGFSSGIIGFNDKYAKNAEEVKSVLRGVAAALEHGGKV